MARQQSLRQTIERHVKAGVRSKLTRAQQLVQLPADTTTYESVAQLIDEILQGYDGQRADEVKSYRLKLEHHSTKQFPVGYNRLYLDNGTDLIEIASIGRKGQRFENQFSLQLTGLNKRSYLCRDEEHGDYTLVYNGDKAHRFGHETCVRTITPLGIVDMVTDAIALLKTGIRSDKGRTEYHFRGS